MCLPIHNLSLSYLNKLNWREYQSCFLNKTEVAASCKSSILPLILSKAALDISYPKLLLDQLALLLSEHHALFPRYLTYLGMFQEAILKFEQKLLLWAWSGRGISSKSWAYRHNYKILNLIFLIAVLYLDIQNWNLSGTKQISINVY